MEKSEMVTMKMVIMIDEDKKIDDDDDDDEDGHAGDNVILTMRRSVMIMTMLRVKQIG
jgi:hypothetical protein